jgi:cation-transporting ATPase E
MKSEIKGLSLEEVNEKKSLGLSNEIIDSYNSTYLKIYLRNIFNLVNLILIPLLLAQAHFQRYKEIFAFSTFLIINTAVSILDEVRIKRKLDKLKSQFQQTARVIRNYQESTIPVSQIVQGDYIIAAQGEGIIADGEIIYDNYLQVDESMLTGESNYIKRESGEKVLSGSYVVTGECIYIVQNVGKTNYLNKLGTEAVKIREKKSPIQKAADKIIIFLVISSITVGAINFYLSTSNNASYEEGILSLTTIIALIIPQTLIFLFTLTFTISITKLYSKGILIQKGGSIEDLSRVDTICFDKTGTITTNDMKLVSSKYWNISEEVFGTFYKSTLSSLVGVNKTQELLNNLFKSFKETEIENFDQLPFTSKQKYSLFTANHEGKKKVILLGAYSAISQCIQSRLRDDIAEYLITEESKGFRVLIGIYQEIDSIDLSNPLTFESNKIVMFSIEETLNPGIKDILQKLKDQGIAVKIISGDSKLSVSRIAQRIDISENEIADLSEANIKLEDIVEHKSVFTRAKPEDKLTIINLLKNRGHNVAMVGDGINDVLGLKAANVSIAMESGSKITRDVSDIVLLKNDYSKIPDIFFEGENIIFNLKLSTKMFLVKSFFAILVALFYSFQREVMPLNPTSTLIFSFLGSSAPSYILVFTRQKVNESIGFFKDVLRSAIPVSLLIASLLIILKQLLSNRSNAFIEINSALVILVLSLSLIYSIYLVWESGKLKNIFLTIPIYVLLIAVGIYQTLLPYDYRDEQIPNLIMVGLMLVPSILLFYTLGRTLRIKRPLKFIISIIISVIWIPAALVFPFREYYSVTRIPFETYVQIGILSLIGLFGIVLIGLLVKKFWK